MNGGPRPVDNTTDHHEQPTSVFSAPFCHPPQQTATAPWTAADWEQCINNDATTCAAPCIWSNGLDLIPEKPYFCAPKERTNDTQVILGCSNANITECLKADQCQPYPGKIVGANTQATTTQEMFVDNFCHPYGGPGIDVGAEWPRCIANQDEQSCAQERCIWSTGKTFFLG